MSAARDSLCEFRARVAASRAADARPKLTADELEALLDEVERLRGYIQTVAAGGRDGRTHTTPVFPLKSVSAYMRGTVVVRGVQLAKEVIWIVDANGNLWRREGAAAWEQIEAGQ